MSSLKQEVVRQQDPGWGCPKGGSVTRMREGSLAQDTSSGAACQQVALLVPRL